MTFYSGDLPLTFAAGHGNTAKCLLYVLCKVMRGRLLNIMQHYVRSCKLRGILPYIISLWLLAKLTYVQQLCGEEYITCKFDRAFDAFVKKQVCC